MPKATKLHVKGKSNTLQKPCKVEKNSPEGGDPEESVRQFQLELCWCIQQLERSLREKKGNEKQMQETWKVLTVLKNNNQPIIRKRQLMRTHFGDYRAKMAAEEKKLAKMASKIKISEVPDKPKATFVRKSAFLTTGDNSFRFNFNLEPEQVDNNKDSGDSALKDGNSDSNDGKTASTDGNAASNDGNTASNDSNTASNDGNTASNDSKTASNDGNTASNDGNTASNDGNTVSNDSKTASNDGNTASNDGNTASNDGNTVSNNDNTVTNDKITQENSAGNSENKKSNSDRIDSKNFKFSFSGSQFKFNFNVDK